MATPEDKTIIHCPSCNHPYKVKATPAPRTVSFMCNHCGQQVSVTVKPATEATIRPDRPNPLAGGNAPATDIKGTVRVNYFDPSWTVAQTRPPKAVLRITMHRRILPATVKSFPLDGFRTWTIGRSDISTRSDIEITGDDAVSRRSAAIEAVNDRNGASFLFKVLNSRNPIYINDRPLGNGETIQLCFGDSIIMGKTSMTFSAD